MKLFTLLARLLTATFFVLAADAGSCAEEDPPPSDEVLLASIRKGYQENREAFHSFTCRFKVREGHAPTVEAAINGKLEHEVTRTGLWVVDGSRVRYELICDAPANVQTPSRDDHRDPATGVMTSVDCDSIAILADARFELRYSPLLNGCNINEIPALGPSISLTPITMQVMGRGEILSPAAQIQSGLTNHGFCRLEEGPTPHINGLQIVTTGRTVHDRDGTHLKSTTWHLDPDRGFWPIRIVSRNGRDLIRHEVFTTDIRQCSNGRYFPERSVCIWIPQSPPPLRVQIIELLDLDVDKPPPEDDFALRLPRGTPILNPVDNRAFYRTDDSKRITLADLPGVMDRCREELRRRTTREPATPAASRQ